MAERRMCSRAVLDSDVFLDMPPTSQLLYVHFGVRADDEGFVGQPRSIMRLCCASEDDLKLLIAKGFIIPFESGVIVITHCNINNQLRKDRQKPTIYEHERATLETRDNGVYALTTNCQPNDNQVSTKCLRSIGEYSRVEISREG